MQKFRADLSKSAWAFGLLCGKVKKSRLGIVITWFSVYSILGDNYYLMLVRRSQFFEYLRETLHKHALEHLEAGRSEKSEHLFLPAVNA